MGCAHGTVRPPTRLERKSRVAASIERLDSVIVPDIHQCSVARPTSTIAAIVGAQQPNARVEVVAHRPAVWCYLPRMIAEAYTFPLSARSADQLKNTGLRYNQSAVRGGASSKRETEPRTIGSRTAERLARRFNAKVVQEYRSALVSRIGPD